MIIGIELEGFECGVLLEGIGPGFVITQSRKRDPCARLRVRTFSDYEERNTQLQHIETQKMKNEKQTVLTLGCFKDLQVLVTLFVCVSALDFGPYS